MEGKAATASSPWNSCKCRSKFSSAITQKKKIAVWSEIAAAISSSDHAVRLLIDVRKKWVDLKKAGLKAN